MHYSYRAVNQRERLIDLGQQFGFQLTGFNSKPNSRNGILRQFFGFVFPEIRVKMHRKKITSDQSQHILGLPNQWLPGHICKKYTISKPYQVLPPTLPLTF